MKKTSISIALIAIVSFLPMACGHDENKIYPIRMGDNWGYVTHTGKYLVNPSFEDAGFFHFGLARIVKEGKVGYINTKGKLVIDPVYEAGTDFSEGRAFVVKEGETPVCINTSGKVIYTCPDWVNKIFTYKNGFAKVVSVDNETAYLDKTGKELCPRLIDGISFSDGMAWRRDSSSTGYINANGKLCITLPQESMSAFFSNYHSNSSFSEGLAAVKGKSGKYGYIDRKGNLKIGFQFEEADLFSEGVALVKIGGQYGYIDKKGAFVINPQFTDARSFQGGLAAIKQGDSWGYVNLSGTIVINPIYSAVCNFRGGYAFVRQDSKLGIINEKGKIVVDPQFDSAWLTVPGATETSVLSRKFTGTKFVSDFLKRHQDGTWDGITASMTLGEIRAKYKGVKADDDNTFIYNTDQEPIDGISLTEIIFMFNEKTYKMVDNYVNGWYGAYKSGKKRQYKNDLKVSLLSYSFTIDKSNKTFSAAHALAEGLAKELNAEIKDQYDNSQLNDMGGILLTKEDVEAAAVFYDTEEGIIMIALPLSIETL